MRYYVWWNAYILQTLNYYDFIYHWYFIFILNQIQNVTWMLLEWYLECVLGAWLYLYHFTKTGQFNNEGKEREKKSINAQKYCKCICIHKMCQGTCTNCHTHIATNIYKIYMHVWELAQVATSRTQLSFWLTQKLLFFPNINENVQ